jgi:ATP-binding protein involved in chromosome partitioning
MFQQVRVEILGLIENMSYFQCPQCGARTEIFNHGGGEKTAKKFGVPFLGGIPLDAGIRQGGDTGTPIIVGDTSSPVAKAFTEIADNVAKQVEVINSSNLNDMIIQ